MSLPSTKLVRTNSEKAPAGPKASKQSTMAKQRKFLYLHVSQTGYSAEIAEDVNAFYNEIVLFADMY